MKNMTLAKWLTDNNYSYVEEAEMYEIGQELTEDEAWHVRRILTRSYLDSNKMHILADTVELRGWSYQQFFYMLVKLMEAENNAWFSELEVTFDKRDDLLWFWIVRDREVLDLAFPDEELSQDEADEMEDE